MEDDLEGEGWSRLAKREGRYGTQALLFYTSRIDYTNNINNNSEVLLGAIIHRPDARKIMNKSSF